MEKGKNDKNPIARRQFLRNCGTIIAAGSVVAISGNLLKKAIDKNKINPDANAFSLLPDNKFVSPYKLAATFDSDDAIKCFEFYQNQLFLATDDKLLVCDISGKQLAAFAIASGTRDIAIAEDCVYLLLPTGIDVYSLQGEKLRSWQACSDNSDYCSFALSSDSVFVTDAANKHICKYSKQGNFEKFINSPNRFIIPSYTFGIEVVDKVLYCSNSGRHQIERFTLDGEYLGAFGKAGGEAGSFTGCCNPVHITRTASGDLLTSEKGDPRISCYGKDGQFHSILLDSKLLGGGNKAYDVKIDGDKLFIASAQKVSIFGFDRNAAAETACGNCPINCFSV